jgi:integrase
VRIRDEIADKITLPDPLPFAGVKLEGGGSSRYVSRINPQTIVAAARKGLKKKDPEAYKVFLLGLFTALRKGEIDLCEWAMIDWHAGEVRLTNTDYLHLKTKGSEATIAVDPEVLEELRSFKPSGRSRFIINCDRPPRPSKSKSVRAYHRCEPIFKRLYAWLRSKGITSNKPLHELRKEAGALVTTKQGIYAAMEMLRHADITTTARHYADHKGRITVGIGKLLDTEIKAV